jgi:malic enzyme
MKLAAAKAIADSVYDMSTMKIVPDTLNMKVAHEVARAVKAAIVR